MRIDPIRHMNTSRRPSGRVASSDAPQDNEAGRALVPVEAAASAREHSPRRFHRQGAADAALVAHLIATRDGHAQTRPLRRVSSGEGTAAYGRVQSVVKAVPVARGFSVTA